jgi:hypothetical protein
MSVGLTWLIWSLALMVLIKNLGCHSLPPSRRIRPEIRLTELEWFLSSWQRLQREENISAYTSQHREFRWNEGTRCVPYFPILVHEEASDECAREQLIVDRFRLCYRGTSTPASIKTARTLPRTESWVLAWLASLPGLLLILPSTSWTKMEGQLARRGME